MCSVESTPLESSSGFNVHVEHPAGSRNNQTMRYTMILASGSCWLMLGLPFSGVASGQRFRVVGTAEERGLEDIPISTSCTR